MKRDVLRLLTATLLSGLTLSAAQAQESARANPLQRANRTFAAADLNRDGRIDSAEASKASISSSVLKSWDKDVDQTLSKDEFLSYYRQLMVNAGQEPGVELDKEVKRIEAASKAREERDARKKEREEARATARKGAEAESTIEKYKRAQSALSDRLRRAGASGDVAAKRQELLKQRARSANGTARLTGHDVGATETARERLARAQAALEERARNAGSSREQLARAQAKVEQRARNSAGTTPASGATATSGASASTRVGDDRSAELRKKLARANEALVERAQAGDMTREQQQALKQKLEERARNAAQAGAAPGGGGAGVKGAKTAQPVSEVKQAGTRSAQGVKAGGATKARDQELAGVPATDRQKVGRALDAMEARAKAGNWSREKLAKEKRELVDRAKAAKGTTTGGEALERRATESKPGRAGGAKRRSAPPKSAARDKEVKAPRRSSSTPKKAKVRPAEKAGSTAKDNSAAKRGGAPR